MRNMEHLANSVIEFVRSNQSWMVPIAFLFAFGESLAFISLVLPSTVILVAIAGLIGAAGISFTSFVPVWLAAGIGGALGYALSYWIGYYFKDDIDKIWPFKTRPEMLQRGREFFHRWGTLGVFLGHFFGPVRAVIPVVAGTFGMQQIPFQIANISSAFLWAAGVLILPMVGGQWLFQ
jgi:membrane protein DedA with SNARE-associated domain